MSKRCPTVHPDDTDVQCIHTSVTSHTTHAGWDASGNRYEWRTLVGPGTDAEWRAVAWSLTDGLGIKIYYDIGDTCLRVDHEAVALWWDEQTPQFHEELVTNYRASVMEV